MHVQACTGGKLAGMQAVKENDQSMLVKTLSNPAAGSSSSFMLNWWKHDTTKNHKRGA